MQKNKKTTKFILYLLVILIIVPTVLFSAPKKTHAILGAADTVIITDDESKESWEQRAYRWVTAPSSVSTSVSTGASLSMKIEAAGKEVLRQAIIAFEHQLFAQITQSTVNWINSGFHGSPLFVQNPDAFFGNIEQTEIKTIINTVGYDPNQPFGQQYALNLINEYKQSSQRDAQYSLSQVTNDPVLLNNYRTNFASGGWSAFLVNTMYPQNNYLGYTMKMNQTVAQKLAGAPIQNTIQKATTMLSQGNGFLSPTKCPAGIPNADNYNSSMTNEFSPPVFNESQATTDLAKSIPDCIPQDPCSNEAAIMAAAEDGGSDDVEAPACIPQSSCSNQAEIDSVLDSMQTSYEQDQANFNTTSACIDPKTGKSALVATTPGAVVSDHIMDALDSNGRLGELDTALGNSMSAILNALMNHFLQEGLSGLSGTITGSSSPSNWSYQGQTLGATTTSKTNSLVVPTSVLVKTGSTTAPATISGGIAPYSIQTQPNNKIATAKISGASLTVTGVGSGQTSVVIQDSSTPVQTATIQITTSLILDFNNPLALQNITASVQNGTNLTISNGIQPYNITTQPDSSVAIALVSNNTLAIVGVNPGITSMTLQDSSTPANIITLQITIGNETPLVVSPSPISANVSSISTATISGGTPPYTITSPSSNIAMPTVSGNTLTVVGSTQGTTSVTIQDSFSPAETIIVPITIN
jgi:hypothetical protein